MNIGGVQISKKFTALVAGIAFAEYLRQTGQTLEEVQPILETVMVYLGGQSVVDAVKAWKEQE